MFHSGQPSHGGDRKTFKVITSTWTRKCLPFLSSPPVFSWVRVTRSLVLCVCFVDRCLSFCTFYFCHCVALFIFNIRIPRRVSISCSTSDTCRDNLVTNPVISHEWGKDRKCLRQMEHIRGSLWHRCSIAVNQVMVATVKLSKWLLHCVALFIFNIRIPIIPLISSNSSFNKWFSVN
jgi:hypothetical protein